jgi:hypothetical protein
MYIIRHSSLALIIAISLFAAAGCAVEPGTSNSTTPAGSPAASAAPGAVSTATAIPVTLPVLDALFSDEAFKSPQK